MKQLMLDRFYAFLDKPIALWTRPILALLVVPLLLTFTQPLWRISMTAPQYPEGLYMDIFAFKIEGGNEGQHLQEINTLNHYIGMMPLDKSAMADLDWIPFAIGALALMALRMAAVGSIRGLLDLLVVTGYVSVFAFSRFVYRLYVFGHHLSPDAPVKVKPFMPAVLGAKQVANFHIESYPQLGSIYMGIFATGVLVLGLGHLIAGRRAAVRAAKAAQA